ncbi:sugar kinase [Vibrio sp. SCSIO 43135]|uniref:sugar kinase n=1 Tax=Vibrio sp. SCSIO 43135 TaxID=2819096 RepID=UPI0020759FAB|nr:sugar kinase [Vibrio sp. SCSIO 43135]USD43011.1 sugar kinase [Vibrio sp. SCSIO 43135]
MSDSNLNIAFFGECMVEISGTPLSKKFGGDTLNTALYLARLTQHQNVSVHYAMGLGHDELSQRMIANWQQEGIATELVEYIDNKLPGLYMVETDETGERHFLYWRNDAAAKFYFQRDELTKLEVALAEKQVSAVYISGISLAILDEKSRERLMVAITEFSHQGGKVIFDNNYRPQLWTTAQAQLWYGRLLPLVDIALITEDDDQLVWGSDESVQERCLRLGCKEVVIKRGCEPCKVIERTADGEKEHYVSATKVTNVVDTCAAGDSFAAGYLAARLTGQSAPASAELGHKLASIVIQYSGAIIPASAMSHLVNESK